jgi:hypothetical protein
VCCWELQQERRHRPRRFIDQTNSCGEAAVTVEAAGDAVEGDAAVAAVGNGGGTPNGVLRSLRLWVPVEVEVCNVE